MSKQALAVLVACVLAISCATNRVPTKPSITIDESWVDPDEEQDVVRQLPAVLACIRKQDPAACGWDDEEVLSEPWGLALFASDHVRLIKISSWPTDNEIEVHMASESSKSGVIFFSWQKDRWVSDGAAVRIVDPPLLHDQ